MPLKIKIVGGHHDGSWFHVKDSAQDALYDVLTDCEVATPSNDQAMFLQQQVAMRRKAAKKANGGKAKKK